MKRSRNGHFIESEETGQVLGVCLGGDYYAEHETPADQIYWAFGLDRSKLGVERLQATKFPQPLVKTGTVNHKPAMLVYFSARWVGRIEREIKNGANCRKIAGELGLLGWSLEEEFSAAWDSESFGLLVRGQPNIKKLEEVLQLWEAHDICLSQYKKGPFGASGLAITSVNVFSKEEREEMLERDQNKLQLKKAAEKTGIAKKLKNAGLRWHALEPEWTDFFKDPVYHSKYKVIFFLNPHEQDKYNAGWFTVEELLQWIKGKGPVIKG